LRGADRRSRIERCGLGIERLTSKSGALFELNRSVERLKKEEEERDNSQKRERERERERESGIGIT
jgi:hypothetical protein